MKKFCLVIAVFLLTHTVYAQFIVYEADQGTTPYTDYQVFETHSVDLTLWSTTFDMRIKNTGDSPIRVRIKVESFTNTNGEAEFCVNGLCSSPVFQGDIYPLNADYLEIQPGELQPYAGGTKFGNMTTGIDQTQPVDYVLKFFQINEAGNEIGTPLHVICRYTNTAVATEDIEQAEAPSIYPNPADDVITISQPLAKVSGIKICDMSGKLIKQYNISDNTIDISELNQGMYLVLLFNDEKIISHQKLMVK